MISVFVWYLLISITGWLVLPLTYSLFPALTDRGYAFSRIVGLLLWGYGFWLAASLGLVRNDTAGIIFIALLLLAINYWLLRKVTIEELVRWLKGQSNLVLHVELIFVIAFLGWSIVRAANPEIAGTEKPMELAFINAILRSPSFPPHDPWLSGYAISYYYFGYVMVAMLARLSGITGSVAFNLGVSLVYALSAIGAYGVVYNLLSKSRWVADKSAASLSILSPVLILLLGNLEGFLESLHAKGLFWEIGATTSPFWKWLDLVELTHPPQQPYTWIPQRFWWWWRASRVIQDYDYQNSLKEVINEFPAFSYLLADLHPHVLAMPFAFLAMGLALHLFLQRGKERNVRLHLELDMRHIAWLGAGGMLVGVLFFLRGFSSQAIVSIIAGIASWLFGVMLLLLRVVQIRRNRMLDSPPPGIARLDFELGMSIQHLLLGALIMGGLAFLNTWDFPFYVAIFAGVHALKMTTFPNQSVPTDVPNNTIGLHVQLLFREFLKATATVGSLGVILYLPFYLGFSSQAGGILPNILYPTRGAQLWIMFAPLLVPLGIYLVFLSRARSCSWTWHGIGLTGAMMVGLFVLSLLFVWLIGSIPAARDIFLSSLGAPGIRELVLEGLRRRLVNTGGWLTLFVFIGGILGYLLPTVLSASRRREIPTAPERTDIFVLFISLVAAMLVLIPEYFYLRDQFGWRINTIFKFYYQAWLIWGVTAAYASGLLLHGLSRLIGWLFRLIVIVVYGMAFFFIFFGLISKTNGFQRPYGWTLDGAAHLEKQSPDMMAAVHWLRNAPPGVLVEAVSPSGGSYTNFASISMLSGQPAVLGWVGHESQWRGGSKEIGSRQADVELLYCTRDWETTRGVIEIYNIRYIYVGNLERSTYAPGQGACDSGLNEGKFRQHLTPVFEQGDSIIFATH